ncbi:MAG: DMT family transporter [Desulfovibrio sp.]|nr:DMT family transporter [Desulfovibrio sp.]
MKYFLSSPEEWALCFVTMVWGVTFLVIRLAMEHCPPFLFVALRFSCAACIVFCLSFPVLRRITRREIMAGVLLGVIVFFGFGLQTLGLTSISSGKSAFITAFYVPLVPLVEILLMHHMPESRVVKGLLLSFPGVLFVSWSDSAGLGLGLGETVTLICAFVFALEIVVLGLVAPGTNARCLVFVELLVTAVLGFAAMPVAGEEWIPMPSWVWASVIGLGLATALIQNVITWAQKVIAPSRATVLYAGEPVWAAFFGFLAGESLGLLDIVGCVLILTGILVSSGDRS